jgi:AraC-like DNA-binding protein
LDFCLIVRKVGKSVDDWGMGLVTSGETLMRRCAMPGKTENGARKANELDSALAVLVEKINRWTSDGDDPETGIPALTLRRFEAPTEKACYLQEPSICVIAQGSKRVLLGEEEYEYDSRHYLLTSVGMPVVAHVSKASPAEPYLSLMLKLDLHSISQLMVDSKLPAPGTKQASRGMAMGEVTPPLINSLIRLIDLLDEPVDIPILAPMVQREIAYRLLVGDQGRRLRQIASTGSQSQQIARAIDWLKENYSQPFRIDDLAAESGMSTSTFHHHFRSVTAMSPLQFQKRLRLSEARRLMLTDNLDASTASFQVGYESPSQFNREYSRLFGAPPLRDIKSMRQVAAS